MSAIMVFVSSGSDEQVIDALEFMARHVNGALAVRIGKDIGRWNSLGPHEKLVMFRFHRSACFAAAPLLRSKDRISHAEEALANESKASSSLGLG